MKVITPPNTVEIFIQPFLKASSAAGKNEQVWTDALPQSRSVSKFEVYKDKVIAYCEPNEKVTIIPKKSQLVLAEDHLQANCLVSKIVESSQNGTIVLSWKKYKGSNTILTVTSSFDAESVVKSLDKNVHLIPEIIKADGSKSPGLRPPQIGAIYAIMSNIAISKDPVCVVLPTGTGKSESILGTIVSRKLLRSLIIVPSDGLRHQFYKNAQSWGILRETKTVECDVSNPIVCKLGSLKEKAEIVKMIMGSNIIIATAAILSQLSDDVLSVINENVDAVFIDEAHHSAAPTWEEIKSELDKPKIIQFTATPFREDGKHIGAKIIFNYPLEEAQKNEYFTNIDFVPVVDHDESTWDKTIADKAIELLRKDIADGESHILMARVDNIPKARKVFRECYEQHSEFNPILITSKSASSDLLIEKLRKGESKIVVCVNMLGEGIDIPQLKIAALHDIRKSLTVTLQFIGRFTRSNKSKSPAKVVANIADVKIEKKLKQLYQEDADWGKLIAFSSAKEIQKRIKFQEMLMNFKNSKIPLFNIKPKLSAVVYKTKNSKWKPTLLSQYLENEYQHSLVDINEQDGIAIGIYQVEENIDWLDSKVYTETSWELLLFYFDKENQLLYVNSSEKNVDRRLVNSISAIDFAFDKEYPFKCYSGLGYVVLFTLGLDKNTDSPIKYAMYAGTDIADGISEMEKNKSSKSNTYGYGYKDGIELTLGASKHGKIWSRLIGNIEEWKSWCDEIGAKLIDDDIDVNEIFKGFLQPKRFNHADFPNLPRATSIDYPSIFYQEMESQQHLIIDDISIPITEMTLSVSSGTTGFEIVLDYGETQSILDLVYTGDSFEYIPRNFKTIQYRKKKKTIDFLPYLKDEDTFRIRLLDGTFVENNYHFASNTPDEIFSLNPDLITTVDWTGVNISSESRGLIAPFITDSVQEKVFKDKEATGRFSVIVNDDSNGEAADLLCFGMDDDYLVIEVIHCKFMISTEKVGARIEDFYQLCGQAQKNIKSIPNIIRLYDHIRDRELKLQKRGGTRFLVGDLKSLELLLKNGSYRRPKIKVILVQPALGKALVSPAILELLGSTYTLLKETVNAEFEVLSS